MNENKDKYKYKNKYKNDFLKRSLLGRDVDLDSADEIITRCIELADRDMMAGGRFAHKKFNKATREERVECVKTIFTNNTIKYKQLKELEEMCGNIFWEFNTIEKPIENSERDFNSFGLFQKLINMTFKYLYIFEDDIKNSIKVKTYKEIDFSQCGCPLDSVILKKAEGLEGVEKNIKWTNMTFEQYEKIQDEINKEINKEENKDKYGGLPDLIGNLAYDMHWSNKD